MKILSLILMVATLGTAQQGQKSVPKPMPPKEVVPPAKPPQVTVCTPNAPRGPSLMLLDAKGKCWTGYKEMKGKDGKAMYCVNVKPSKPPLDCKTAQAKGKK